MKNTVQRDWLYLLGFMVFGAAAFGLYYLAAERFASPGSLTARFARPGIPNARQVEPDGSSEKILLAIDEPQILGNIKVTYRGVAGHGKIRLDVILGELDPHRHYPYHLNIQSAKKSFTLAGRHYRLVDVGKTRMEMKLLSGKGIE